MVAVGMSVKSSMKLPSRTNSGSGVCSLHGGYWGPAFCRLGRGPSALRVFFVRGMALSGSVGGCLWFVVRLVGGGSLSLRSLPRPLSFPPFRCPVPCPPLCVGVRHPPCGVAGPDFWCCRRACVSAPLLCSVSFGGSPPTSETTAIACVHVGLHICMYVCNPVPLWPFTCVPRAL